MKISPTIDTRFYSKVLVLSGDDACWIWQGAVDAAGRGMFRVYTTAATAPWRAYRVAWLLVTGEDPGDLMICHRCDNPRCVRFDHLFKGTAADNHADMRRKGRNVQGDQHPGVRLLNTEVAAIRQRLRKGEGVTALSREFNVSHLLISRIRDGSARREVA